MTEPRQPKDPPPHADKAHADKAPADPAHAPRGVPIDADEAEPKGTPHSDRHDTETAGNKSS